MLAPRTLPDGSRAWVDSHVKDFTDALTAYDDRLALVQNQRNHTWEIWRVAEDGSEYIVMRSKPGRDAQLGPGVIQHLADRDARRHGTSLVEGLIKHNEKAEDDARARYEESAFLALDKMLSKSWRGHVPSNIEDLDLK